MKNTHKAYRINFDKLIAVFLLSLVILQAGAYSLASEHDFYYAYDFEENNVKKDRSMGDFGYLGQGYAKHIQAYRIAQKSVNMKNADEEGSLGMSVDNPVMVNNVDSHVAAIRFEKRYIFDKYGKGLRFHGQSLINHNNRWIDKLEFETSDGRKHSIYFDITKYFPRE